MNENVIQKSLRYSLIDGIFASIMIGFSETFITPYALAMKASARLIGILASLPGLIGALLQVRSAELVERLGSRKKLINTTVFLHALLWLPIISIPYLFKDNQAVYLIIFYTIFVAMGLISFPAWSSLMSDHVRENERGKVFGWRNKLFGIINVSSMFMAGLTLHIFKRFVPQYSFLGFTVIFAIAFVARLFSWKFLTMMYEPPLAISKDDRFTIVDFLKRMRHSNFGRFVFFTGFMNFSVFLAGPYFAVFMLRELRFDYLTYTIVVMSATLTTIFMTRVWGLWADKFGNVKILKTTSYLIPLIPMLWLVSHNVLFLILIQVYAGFLWSGYHLSASNFIYDAVTPAKRTRCIAYFNVINGIGVFAGAATGGYLVRHLPPLFGYNILTLFLLSGILRLMAIPIGSVVKEVRQVKDISSLELFYSVITKRII